MAKFSKAKVGDRVWSTSLGWGTVDEIIKPEEYDYPLGVKFDIDIHEWYTMSGGKYIESKLVELYWNEIKLPTEEEDQKPFNLVEFLKNNLKPIEFEVNTICYSLLYEARRKVWGIDQNYLIQKIGVYFENIDSKVIEELNEYKITPQQVKEAYKELGWL